jgi:hypothetical protein
MTGRLARNGAIHDEHSVLVGNVIAIGTPWRSAQGDMRSSFGARGLDGLTYSGTLFADRTVRMTPNHRS